MHALREALASFGRSPLLTMLSATMIGLSLFLVGLFGIVAHNIRVVLRDIESRVQVVAYLRDDARPAEVDAARQEILALAAVSEVIYISREQALLDAQAELPELRSVFGGLDSNPLPASLEIALEPNQQGPESVRAVADHVGELGFVEDVQYGSDWLDKVFLLRRVAGVATIVLGGAFAIVATLIIGAAMRLAIYARRDEISIMRLVGATHDFVRRPFLIEGFIAGLLGGGLALALTYGTYDVLSDRLLELAWLPETWVVAGIAAGCVLGVAASAAAVRRYLEEI